MKVRFITADGLESEQWLPEPLYPVHQRVVQRFKALTTDEKPIPVEPLKTRIYDLEWVYSTDPRKPYRQAIYRERV